MHSRGEISMQAMGLLTRNRMSKGFVVGVSERVKKVALVIMLVELAACVLAGILVGALRHTGTT